MASKTGALNGGTPHEVETNSIIGRHRRAVVASWDTSEADAAPAARARRLQVDTESVGAAEVSPVDP